MTSFLKKAFTKNHYPLNHRGFTIVELIVVIAVIAILAAIAIVSYGSWRQQTIENSVKSDLSGAASAMNDARNFGVGYPSSIPSTFISSADVSLNLFEYTTNTFCIDGTSITDATVNFYIDQNSGSQGAQAGTCATRPSTAVPAAPANVTVSTFIGTTQANLTWDMVSGVSNYIAQCASDPAFLYTIGQVTSVTNSATITGLASGGDFYCRVKATNTTGAGGWSAVLNDNTNYWTSFTPNVWYGNNTYAIKSDGSLWAWGGNSSGQVGNNSTTSQTTPVKIISSGVTNVTVGSATAYAIKSDGSLWAWGYNGDGNIGNGSTTNRTTPVQVIASGVTSVATSDYTAYAIKSDGSLWAWGYNGYGQVGNGSTTKQTTPVQVIASGVTSVTISSYTAYAIKSDGSLWAWGANGSGQVGNGSTTNRTTPVQVIASGMASFWTNYVNGNTAYAIKSDGSLWAWGANDYSQVGNGSTTSQTTPLQIIASGVTSVRNGGINVSVYAIKSDGSLWAWGANGSGQVGNGSTTTQSTPTQVIASGVTNVKVTIGVGSTTQYAIKSDGSLWAWGRNDYGQVGNGSTINQTTPVQVIASGVTSVVTSLNSYAIKSDGSLWAWGRNDYGQVGNGSTTNQTIPVQIIPSGVVGVITTTYYNAHAIKSDGSIWAWGYNGSYGRLGNGSTTSATTPVLIRH